MSNLPAEVETAIQTKFKADVWLGDSDNVKTIEVGVRESLLQAWDVADAFRPEELPAIQIIALVDRDQAEQSATCTLTHTVPVVIVGLVRAAGSMSGRPEAARQAALELKGQLSRVLDSCRKTSGGLALAGRSRWVQNVNGQVEVVNDESSHYGLALLGASVKVIREFS